VARDRAGPRGHAWAVLAVTAATLVSWAAHGRFDKANLIMVYLLGVTWVAVLFGRGPAVLASCLSVAAFDFFFVPPHLTFAVDDAQYLLTFAGMLIVGLTISTLTGRLREQAEGAKARARRATALWELSRDLAGAEFESVLLNAAARHARELFAGESVVLLPGRSGELEVRAGDAAALGRDEREREVAEWVEENGRPAGAFTAERRGARGLYVPIRGPAGDVLGILGVSWESDSPAPPEDPVRLLETFANQVAVALGRVRQEEAAEWARQGPRAPAGQGREG
jgi:two-component system sensor histidine kinase KdpD